MLKIREVNTKTVLFLFLCRLLLAIFLIERISFSAVFFFISVYFAVSIAEYLAAFLEGLLMLKNTVSNTKRIVKIKIAGCTDCTIVSSSSLYSQFFKITGNKSAPNPYPTNNPIGIPIRDKRNICLRINLLICLPVIPIVFIIPNS